MLKDKLLPVSENYMLAKFNQIIEEIIANRLKYVIWGAGNTGTEAIQYIETYSNGKISHEYIVDNNKMMWKEDRIVGANAFENDMNNIDVVLVCVYVADQIEAQLRAMNYGGKIFAISASVFDISDEYIRYYDSHMQDIETVYNLMADEKSQKTIETFLNVIRTGNIELWNEANSDSRYKLIDPSVLKLSTNENFVDIGAFTGDTIEKFLEITENNYSSIICIEPDIGNFTLLEENINKRERIVAINAAAGDQKGVLKFSGGKSESCIISDEGEMTVDIIRIDDIEDAKNTSVLKVSTNGYDLGALKGAEELIKRNRPQIATYISGDQLWTVPNYLKKIVPEYSLYIRHYGIGRQAMILYALP